VGRDTAQRLEVKESKKSFLGGVAISRQSGELWAPCSVSKKEGAKKKDRGEEWQAFFVREIAVDARKNEEGKASCYLPKVSERKKKFVEFRC